MAVKHGDRRNSIEDFRKTLLKNSDLVLLADYIQQREKGLRELAFKVLDQFILKTESFSSAHRRNLVRLICEKKIEWYKNDNWFDPHPLVQRFILPTIEQWIRDDPENPEPYKYNGFFYAQEQKHGDPLENLEKALRLNPNDDVVRMRIVDNQIHGLWYATHHVYDQNGAYVDGNASDDLIELEKAISLCSEIAFDKARIPRMDELYFYQQLLGDWLEYKTQNTEMSFYYWCKDRERLYSLHGWHETYNYQQH